MLINLTKLTKDEVDEALLNAGYEHNNLVGTSFKKNLRDGLFIYDIVFRNHDGELEPGMVYVQVDPDDGIIKADF